VYVSLQDQTPSENGIYKKICHTIANFSYTLYLVHLPVLIFCQAWLITNSRWQTDLFHISTGIILLITVNLYAFAIAQITEAKTEQVRKFILKKINK
jgi:peptidoglycan/LPS O-acetylase OafA/YrhL